MTPPKAPKAAPSTLAMFDAEPVYEAVTIRLPPIQKPAEAVSTSSVDLSAFSRVWGLIGRGATGKTMLARWLGNMMDANNSPGLLAALDPTNRTLAQFFNDVHQPETQRSDDAAAFLRKLVKFASSRPVSGVWDFGGGDLSLSELIAISPQFDRDIERDGTAFVAAYLFSPSVDDIATLATFEEAGFQPRATALILNLARGSLAEFGRLRAQPSYKAALARGAVEILMPKLHPAYIAGDIEGRRLHFTEAASGVGLDAAMTASWLRSMDAAFKPVQTWLPWS